MSATEKRLSLFIECAPAALAMFDADMRYLSASRRWISDYGLAEGNLYGRCHYDLFPRISERWREIYRCALAGEVLRGDMEPFARADGSMQWIRWEAQPWRNPQGGIEGIMADSAGSSVIRRNISDGYNFIKKELNISDSEFIIASGIIISLIYILK